MPRTTEQFEEIRNERRKVIIDYALQLFANRGYASTSISMIAKEAGISKGLMYNYFESKEELLKTIVMDLVTELTDVMDANKDGMIDEQEMSNVIDFYFYVFKNRHDELKLYYQLNFQPEVQEYMRNSGIRDISAEYQGLLSTYFTKKFPDNHENVLLDFVSTMKGFSMIYVFSKESFPEEMIENYKAYLKRMYTNNH